MFGIIMSLVKIPLTIAMKIIKFFGLYWLILWMVLVFIIEGKFGTGNTVIILEDVVLVVGLVLAVLTTIQNLVRMVKRDNFSIYGFIGGLFKKKQEVGTVAKTEKRDGSKIHGIVFGKLKGEYVVKPENEMGVTLILGGARSGKSSGIAIPTLKSWNGSVFTIDIKGELYDNTKDNRIKKNRTVKKFAPCDRSTSGYNPFNVLKTSRNKAQAATEIAMAIVPCPPDAKDQFWFKQAQEFLAGAILHYSEFGASFPEVMREIKLKSAAETVAFIMAGTNDEAKIYMSQFVGMADETLTGIFAEISQNIRVFVTDQDLVYALSGKGDCITPQDLENGTDIYCCIDEDLLDQWKPLFTMMVNQFIKHFERRELGNESPILFLLDEFPRLGKVEAMTGAVSTLAGRGIHPVLIIQSIAQLNDVYGEQKAKVICDNANYKALLKATDPDTQEWCSKLVGKYDKEKVSTGYNADISGIGKGVNSGKTTEQRYIIEPEEFGYMADKGYLILLAPSGYKKLDKIQWWKDDTFKN